MTDWTPDEAWLREMIDPAIARMEWELKLDSLDDDNPYASKYYGMDGKRVTMRQWMQLMETGDRHVDETFMTVGGQRVWVSTVLLGLDHNFMYGGPPIIFETMVFFAKRDPDGLFSDLGYQVRYATYAQAKAGHKRAVRWARRLQLTKRKPLLHNGRKP